MRKRKNALSMTGWKCMEYSIPQQHEKNYGTVKGSKVTFPSRLSWIPITLHRIASLTTLLPLRPLMSLRFSTRCPRVGSCMFMTSPLQALIGWCPTSRTGRYHTSMNASAVRARALLPNRQIRVFLCSKARMNPFGLGFMVIVSVLHFCCL